MTDWSRIESDISNGTGRPFSASRVSRVSGGCINHAYRLEGSGTAWFVKVGLSWDIDIFESEADGLSAMAATAAIRTPCVICTSHDVDTSWIVLEWIDLRGPADPEALGRALAALHSHHGPSFGWHRDNWIGSSVQRNGVHEDWARFWCERRLGPPLDMAATQGYGDLVSGRDELLYRIRELLTLHTPAPSLVHGDLWSGNAGYDRDSQPVIFDPAVYYGDPEVDVAMTALFGGFPDRFYDAYREILPEAPGYRLRRDVYNLYHVLNHANLFGSGYLGQAKALMRTILR